MYKTTFCIRFFIEHQGSQGSATLDIDLPFAPSSNIEFEHPTWKNPRKPLSVSYNINDSTFYINLGTDELKSGDDVQSHKKMYESHGWSVS